MKSSICIMSSPSLCIVGTHRLADDKLWTEALSLGASDICEPRNDDVVRSLLHRLTRPCGRLIAVLGRDGLARLGVFLWEY